MSIVVTNAVGTVLDIPGAGLVFDIGESKTVTSITEPLSAAIQAGQITVGSQEATAVVTVESDGDTEFDLPFNWPGPDDVSLFVGGLLQVFGTDWSVDAEANTFEWLDGDIDLEEDDVLVFTGRWSE